MHAPAMPARPDPKAKVSMFTRSVLTPTQEAIVRFCITARICRPREVLVSSAQVRKTTNPAKAMIKIRL